MNSDSSSKGDYTKRMASISNKIDIEMTNPKMTTSPIFMPQPSHVHNEAAFNALLQPNLSMLPIPPLAIITNGYLLVCDLQEWSSKGSKMRSSLATKDVVKSEV